jgi:hypothetical protein
LSAVLAHIDWLPAQPLEQNSVTMVFCEAGAVVIQLPDGAGNAFRELDAGELKSNWAKDGVHFEDTLGLMEVDYQENAVPPFNAGKVLRAGRRNGFFASILRAGHDSEVQGGWQQGRVSPPGPRLAIADADPRKVVRSGAVALRISFEADQIPQPAMGTQSSSEQCARMMLSSKGILPLHSTTLKDSTEEWKQTLGTTDSIYDINADDSIDDSIYEVNAHWPHQQLSTHSPPFADQHAASKASVKDYRAWIGAMGLHVA